MIGNWHRNRRSPSLIFAWNKWGFWCRVFFLKSEKTLHANVRWVIGYKVPLVISFQRQVFGVIFQVTSKDTKTQFITISVGIDFAIFFGGYKWQFWMNRHGLRAHPQKKKNRIVNSPFESSHNYLLRKYADPEGMIVSFVNCHKGETSRFLLKPIHGRDALRSTDLELTMGKLHSLPGGVSCVATP